MTSKKEALWGGILYSCGGFHIIDVQLKLCIIWLLWKTSIKSQTRISRSARHPCVSFAMSRRWWIPAIRHEHVGKKSIKQRHAGFFTRLFARRRFLPVSVDTLFPPESAGEEKTEVHYRAKVWQSEILTPCNLSHPYQWRTRGLARCVTSGVRGGGPCSTHGHLAPPSSGRTAACYPGRHSALYPLRRTPWRPLGAEELRGEAGTLGCRTAAGHQESPLLLQPQAGNSSQIA